MKVSDVDEGITQLSTHLYKLTLLNHSETHTYLRKHTLEPHTQSERVMKLVWSWSEDGEWVKWGFKMQLNGKVIVARRLRDRAVGERMWGGQV